MPHESFQKAPFAQIVASTPTRGFPKRTLTSCLLSCVILLEGGKKKFDIFFSYFALVYLCRNPWFGKRQYSSS